MRRSEVLAGVVGWAAGAGVHGEDAPAAVGATESLAGARTWRWAFLAS